MSFYDSVQGIDIPTYDTGGYDGPPRMYWHNGDKRQQTGGSFYIKQDELGGEQPGAPWQACERFSGELGYCAEKLRVAVIGYRQQAFRMDADDRKVWLPEWSEGARIQTEVLCFVQGLETAPIVWVTRGMTGKAITGKGSGILSEYRQKLLQEAAKKAGKVLPLWTFWLPIQTLREANGGIAYPDTGHKSTYTPPMIHLGIANVDKAIESLFVGDQMYVQGAALREEYDGWLKQRRGGVEAAVQAEDEIGFDKPAPDRGVRVLAGRAVSIPDDDIPF